MERKAVSRTNLMGCHYGWSHMEAGHRGSSVVTGSQHGQTILIIIAKIAMPIFFPDIAGKKESDKMDLYSRRLTLRVKAEGVLFFRGSEAVVLSEVSEG